MINKTST